MPGVDWIPGISQLKSVCQLVTGDAEGAQRTQQNFAKECPVVSQSIALGQYIAGDEDGAKDTFNRGIGTINNVANGIPGVGHVKGGIHHLVGDHEGGNQALKAATRSTVVIGSGVAVGLASGGLAAIPAGIAAGSTYDLAHTAISKKPKGIYAVLDNAFDNPNAGNIFDAAAAFAGDGLAGYSGGQIATQVKLNSLESARAAKNDQLTAGMFPEKGTNGMTTGELTSLGQQINALTSEINVIRHGTPQYWWDPKTKQVVVETTSSSGNLVVVSNHLHENNEDCGQNLRLADDYYEGQKEVPLSSEDREKCVKKYVEKKAGKRKLEENELYSKITTIKKVNQLLSNFGKDNNPFKITEEMLRMLNQITWLYVQMPAEFGYTCATLTKQSFYGLQHTFIRHGHQWAEFIPGLNDLMGQLPQDIIKLIEKLRKVQSTDEKNALINELNYAINRLSDADYMDFQLVMLKIQMKIHKCIQINVTSAEYLGEGVNENKRIQVNFKVTDSRGRPQVMVVCVSDDVFPSVAEFYDERDVRIITNVWFITWEKYKKMEKRIRKAWPKK